jgi:Transposase zinc-binding domain
MEEKRLGIEDFKRIFKENYEEFLDQHPEYEKTREVIEKMLGCGEVENGYIEYVCPRCQKKKIVAFS